MPNMADRQLDRHWAFEKEIVSVADPCTDLVNRWDSTGIRILGDIYK
jgi:hypothetical protein